MKMIQHKAYTLSIAFLWLWALPSVASLNFDSNHGNNLAYTFSNKTATEAVKDFINHVLRQCDADKFIAIAHKALHTKADLSNAALYTMLEAEVSSTIPWVITFPKTKALWHQQKILAKQLKTLVGARVIQHYVEIGTPGTYINGLKKYVPIKKATVIHTQTELKDYLHGMSWSLARGFKAYDQFVPLQDYAPISEDQIPSHSVDVVTCLIGLHHIPTEKLEPFLKSVYRILKPGGIFILRDHDAKDEKIKAMVQAAHTIFNLVTMRFGLADELKEYRNFQPLSFWIEKLTQAGFVESNEEKLYQAGDPTLNVMVKFTKPVQTLKDIELEAEGHLGYKRDITKTILSAPEWHNVLTTVEYTKFIHYKPFYAFPYFGSITSFWEVFGKSWRAARQYQSFWEVLTHDYTQMNLFIGLFMTVEYTVKGIISAPLRWFIQDSEPRTIQMIVRDPKGEATQAFPGVHILKTYEMDDLKVIEVPRYKAFMDAILGLEAYDLEIVSIAGNSQIQFTLKHTVASSAPLRSTPGIKILYPWQFPTVEDKIFTAVTVDVGHLKDVLKTISKHNIDVFYVHDF